MPLRAGFLGHPSTPARTVDGFGRGRRWAAMLRSPRFPAPVAATIALLLLGLLLLGPGAARGRATSCGEAGRPAYAISAKAAAKATLCLLNRKRSARGLRPLHSDKRQLEAARKHNRAMLKKNCFSHLCPGEKDLVGRVASTGYLPCSCTWGIAENIAWGAGSRAAPAAVVRAWMRSPSHRANILNRRFDEIGIAVSAGRPGRGGGPAATYTTDFGFRD